MRLTATRADMTPADLDGLVGGVLDRRLHPDSKRPIALALSGGGDSLALLLAAAAWARRAGRRLIVLTIDHGLRAASADWTRTCAATAARLDLPFQALHWNEEKPATGLPAAARLARHRLLANAARAADARVILLGHTADDVLEAGQMRAAGSTTPAPRGWSPSPVWPEGRGLFLLRPLLDARRAAIREWLAARGETWIDDPANDDTAYARPRARQALAAGAAIPMAPSEDADARGLAAAVTSDQSGGFTIERAIVRAADPASLQRFLSAACVCAAGTDRLPQGSRVQALAVRLLGGDRVTATLAGARIEADEHLARIVREAGETARGGLSPLRLEDGRTGIWDGRFEATAIGPAVIQSRRMTPRSADDPPAPRSLIPAARAVMPVVIGQAGLRALTHDRLLAACGAIPSEPA